MKFDYNLIEKIGANYQNSLWGTTYYKVNNDGVFYCKDNVVWTKSGNSIIWFLENLKPIPPRPKEEPAQPIYTQAMCDAGDKAAAGMKCLLNHDEVTVTYIGRGVACYIETQSGNEYACVTQGKIFKPIDTRTEKEKVIDELNKLIHAHKGVCIDSDLLAPAIYNKFIEKDSE